MLAFLAAAPALAQAGSQKDPFRKQAEALIGFFNGKTRPEALFSPAFLAQVPAAQVSGIAAQMRAQFGTAQTVERLTPRGEYAGTLSLEFDRGTLQIELAVDPAPPHLVRGLLITGTQMKGDSFSKVADEMRALPGRASLKVARLGEDAPVILAVHEAERPMAIGSAFKLFLLAEAARSVGAGERKWSDVVPLSHRSLPSGLLQDWPERAPLTLYSLAALMISQSDNSATDTMLHALGRAKIEAILPALGLESPERNRPFLGTMEAFALKAGSEELGKAWLAGGEAERRALLPKLGEVRADGIDIAKLGGKPRLIDEVEWFASADDLVRTLDWLRRNGGQEAREILAINPGIGRAAADRFDYFGYKGGSEPGVINMSFLVRTKSGAWHAVAGSWNDADAPVDEARFGMLMSRAVALLAD